MKHNIHFFAAGRKVARDVAITDCKISFTRKIEKSVLDILVRGAAAPLPSALRCCVAVGPGHEDQQADEISDLGVVLLPLQ